jgi:hypothetical protein
MTTNKPAWTPGPWKLHPWGSGKGYEIETEAALVASVQREMAGSATEANARLIAASPSLAEYVQRKADEGDEEATRLMETVHAAR